MKDVLTDDKQAAALPCHEARLHLGRGVQGQGAQEVLVARDGDPGSAVDASASDQCTSVELLFLKGTLS